MRTWCHSAPRDSASACAPFACGVTTAGDARCWGHGIKGELGAGTMVADVALPQTVSGPQGYETLDVGARFACALQSGTARCWRALRAGL